MEQQFLIFSFPLVCGYLLDLYLGDPPFLPHPVRLFGSAINLIERKINKNRHLSMKGAMMTIGLCFVTFSIFYIAEKLIFSANSYFGMIFKTIFVFYGLANKNLIQEGKRVFDQLHFHGLQAGRLQLSRIVGRTTENLEENSIRIAVFETMSENLNDGVIAPIFYYLIGGIPAMMVYKMINTLDSMIGYKSDRYFYFGKFAARLDDVVNFVPARITAFLIFIISLKSRSLFFILKYGKNHSSPNSGYPEAALAGAIDCRFGGPNWYHGILVNKPFIGNNNRLILNKEFLTVAKINHLATFLFVCLCIAIFYYTI